MRCKVPCYRVKWVMFRLSHSSTNVSTVYTLIFPMAVWMCPLYTWLSLSWQCECVHCIHSYLSHSNVNVSTVYTLVFSMVVRMCPLYTRVSLLWQCECIHCIHSYLSPTAVWMCPCVPGYLSHGHVRSCMVMSKYIWPSLPWHCECVHCIHGHFSPSEVPKGTDHILFLLTSFMEPSTGPWMTWMTSEIMK